MNLPPPLLPWLLSGPPWVVYRTRRDLLSQPEDEPAVLAARQEMRDHPLVRGLLADLSAWPAPRLNSHKSAGHPLHELSFLAGLGLELHDPGIPELIERILARQSQQGPFQMLANISPAYGGSGKDEYAWAMCDAPLVVSGLIQMGLGEDPRLRRAVEHLVGLVRENGWPCAVSPELGKWRGPGKKEDPCPYANLIMLEALSQSPHDLDSQAARLGTETALALWAHSLERHPYMFYMGTDFRKLKAPLVWYDLLHVLDVLSRFPWLRGDPRLQQMAGILASKADEQGRYTPESIYAAWKDWDFGQKKLPSPWLTFLAWRVLDRMDSIASDT